MSGNESTGTRYLLSGGPAEGVVQTDVTSKDGRVWTIEVTHVYCACAWCAPIDAECVTHLYERRDDDVFVYRSSGAAE